MTDQTISQEKMVALNTPHNLTLADNIIDIKVSGFTSTVTLGFTNPANMLQPAITFMVPTNVLHRLANEILHTIKTNSEAIKSQHKILDDQI